MTEIQKLKNVQYKITEEVLTRKWLTVRSKRNRLLALSDWTQLGDVNIPQNIRGLWRRWRQKVRDVNQTTVNNPDNAATLLQTLEDQMPKKLSDIAIDNLPPVAPLLSSELEEIKTEFKRTIDTIFSSSVEPRIISLDDVAAFIEKEINEVSRIIIDNFNITIDKKIAAFAAKSNIMVPTDIEECKTYYKTVINAKYDKMIPPFNTELLNEAVDCLSESESSFPLLQVYATNNNFSLRDMAEKILKDKKEWLRHVCNVEHNRLQYLNTIDKVITKEELETLMAKDLE